MDGSVADMVFTDPPYNVDYEGSDCQKIKNDNMGNEEFYNFLLAIYKNLFANLKASGTIYVSQADSEGLNFRKAFVDAGFKLAQCLIWLRILLLWTTRLSVATQANSLWLERRCWSLFC